jgi:hypothetical protein
MYRQTITRLTAGIPASDAAARAAVYDRMRIANEKIIARNAGEGDAARLRELLDEVITEYELELRLANPDDDPSFELNLDEQEVSRDLERNEPEETAPEMTQRTTTPLDGSNFATAQREPAGAGWPVGLLLGLLLSAACAAAAWWFGAVSLTAGPQGSPRSAEFERRYAVLLPQVNVAAAYLDQVEKEVQKLQAADPKTAAIAAKKFVPLEKILPKVAATKPKTLPAGTKIIVRADGRNYKILYYSVLCSTVQFAKPAMVDAKRGTAGLGCLYFGKWSAGGKAF